MSVKNEIRMMVIKIIFFILGFLAAVFNIAGYYPLYTTQKLIQKAEDYINK